ncbi:hypothetical protein R3P38DRAFT_2797160 [Favolaschia claudopus]|uniref:Uncharacterized protein n=1 Tax=Favolaschia claudopus TaxID=2862362 RepID=A0AAW0A3J7_9AGAR
MHQQDVSSSRERDLKLTPPPTRKTTDFTPAHRMRRRRCAAQRRYRVYTTYQLPASGTVSSFSCRQANSASDAYSSEFPVHLANVLLLGPSPPRREAAAHSLECIDSLPASGTSKISAAGRLVPPSTRIAADTTPASQVLCHCHRPRRAAKRRAMALTIYIFVPRAGLSPPAGKFAPPMRQPAYVSALDQPHRRHRRCAAKRRHTFDYTYRRPASSYPGKSSFLRFTFSLSSDYSAKVLRYATVFLTSLKLEMSSTLNFTTQYFVFRQTPSPNPATHFLRSESKIFRCAALVIDTASQIEIRFLSVRRATLSAGLQVNFAFRCAAQLLDAETALSKFEISLSREQGFELSGVLCPSTPKQIFSAARLCLTWDFKFHGFHADLKFTQHTSGPLPRVRRSETLKQAGKRAS